MFSEAGMGPPKKAMQSSADAGLLGSKSSLVRAVYLAAILIATFGWLSLIAWIALRLV
jgi:hypothetical protein